MKHETKTARARFKAAPDAPAGTFEAIVSVFGNVDLGGDRVVKGAFTKTLQEWADSGDPIPVIWSHEWDDPKSHIGYVVEAEERDAGLWIKAQLDIANNDRAEYVARLLKERRVREFSFGYFARGWREVEEADYPYPVRELTDIELFEVGPTLLGMNPETVLLEAASRFSKAGRVLSSKNEETLRQARDLIDQVLTSVSDEGKSVKQVEQKIATPQWMQDNAQRGLDWYAEGLAGDGVTEQTVREARAMAGGNVSEDKAARMAAWFARHMTDLDAPAADPDHEDYPSPGVVAHALWGGGTRAQSERAMAWAERQVAEMQSAGKAWVVGASTDLEIVERDTWDGAAAEANVFAWAGFDGDSPDPARARQAFLIYDDEAPDLRGSYKLCFADVIDGELYAVDAGLRAAASRLPQTDASQEALDRARLVLDGYFARIDDTEDDVEDDAETASRDSDSTIDHERLAMLLARPRHTEE